MGNVTFIGTGPGCVPGLLTVALVFDADRRVDVFELRFFARGEEPVEVRTSRDGFIVGREWAAGRIHGLLKGATVYSVNAGVDTLLIGDLLAEHGLTPSWDGRVHNVVDIAAGLVLEQVQAGARPQSDTECLWRLPYDDDAVSMAVGVS